jgi:hypothetical protein
MKFLSRAVWVEWRRRCLSLLSRTAPRISNLLR